MKAYQRHGLMWVALLAATFGLSLILYYVGLYLLVFLEPYDRAISAAINPNVYTPVLDEFFRAITDHTNFVLALAIVSLGIACVSYRLSMLSRKRVVSRSLVACVLCWLVLAVLYRFLDIPFEAIVVLGTLPVVVALGAGPRLLFDEIAAKKWITGLLILEAVAFVGLWATKRLWWNEGLPGANYFLLPALVTAFGIIIYLFNRMDADQAARYQQVFLLVLASVLIVSLGSTRILKENVARPRPLAEAYAPWNEVLRPIPEETLRGANSYPSGHTSGTFSLVTPLFWWLRDKRVRVGLVTLGLLQFLSRIYTAAHFFSDCVAGAMIGIGVGTLVYFLLAGPTVRQRNPEPEPQT